MNKKILMSLLLVFIVALSVSAASAADDAVDVVADQKLRMQSSLMNLQNQYLQTLLHQVKQVMM